MNQPLNVLIIDSNRHSLKMLGIHIGMKGNTPIPVTTVTEAMSAIEKQKIDMVLCEVFLESFSGISLLKSIKGSGQIIPVIMMSGYDTPQMVAECLNLGAYDFLAKPFYLAELDEIIINISKRKKRLADMGVTI